MVFNVFIAAVLCSESPSAGVSNSSVRLDWAVEQFNRTCFESFKIFWFTNQTNSSYYQQSVGLDHRSATIGSLVPDTAYYFQVDTTVGNEGPWSFHNHGEGPY